MILQREFYFIRHGQTDHHKGLNLTDEDILLNDQGRLQAREIENLVASLPIKTICFSPLKRAKETKEIVTANLQVPQLEIHDLRECSGLIWKDMTALGAEARLSSKDHVLTFMEQARRGINAALSQEGPVLIVAHGGIHWAMCCFMGVDHEWAIGNCVPVHFSLGNDGIWIAKKLYQPL